MAHIPTHKELHSGSMANRLNWLRASVLGVNDGIISLAALVVGVAGAGASSGTVLVTGIAGILAGALSMAVGEYVSVSSQRDTEKVLLEKERHELKHEADNELIELSGIYERKGLTPETAKQVALELTAHDAFTAHVEAELGIDPENLTNPWQAGIASAIAYSVGAIIPLLTIVLTPLDTRIMATFVAVLIALIITGIVSARVSGARIIPVTIRVVLGGIFAMIVTFGIGKLFNVSV